MSQRGFTLIEMAIVLTVAGLLLGGSLMAIGPALDKAKFNQTNTTMDQVENALVLFVIRNSRLPCPADGRLGSTNNNYGLEQTNGAGACSLAITPVFGVIPWRSLGIDESYSVDGWNDRLSYFPAEVGQAGSTASAGSNNAVLRTSTGAYPLGQFMTVTDASSGLAITPPSASSTDQAAYVLISHGKSGWYSYTKAGVPHAIGFTGGKKACNSDPSSAGCGNSFMSGSGIGAYPPSSNNYFDDMVRWRSAAFLIQLCGIGACGN